MESGAGRKGDRETGRQAGRQVAGRQWAGRCWSGIKGLLTKSAMPLDFCIFMGNIHYQKSYPCIIMEPSWRGSTQDSWNKTGCDIL